MMALDQGDNSGRGEKRLTSTYILKIEPGGMLKRVALREREVYRNTPRFLARAFGWNDGTAIKLRGSVCRWAQNGENGAPSEMLFRQHPSGDIRRQ